MYFWAIFFDQANTSLKNNVNVRSAHVDLLEGNGTWASVRLYYFDV